MSHSAWNSITAAVRASGFMGFMLSLLLVFNIPHGPWADDLRSSQVLGMLEDMCKQPWSRVLPLLEQRSLDVLRESRQTHLLTWDKFRGENPLEKKGSKVNLNRFMSTVLEGCSQLPTWTVRRVCYEAVALELDMLGSQKLQKLMIRDSTAMAADASSGQAATKSTSSRVVACINKEVRKSCDNALVTAVYILGMPTAWRRLAIFVECTVLVQRWHSAQAQAVRNVFAASSWVVEQVCGGFVTDANRLRAPLCLPSLIQRQACQARTPPGRRHHLQHGGSARARGLLFDGERLAAAPPSDVGHDFGLPRLVYGLRRVRQRQSANLAVQIQWAISDCSHTRNCWTPSFG